ncbi:hypothetical protein X559_2044 [Paenilisteria newyorkensis]|nr:hypothetical protein X559_2044 [Listeria newyorkensis]
MPFLIHKTRNIPHFVIRKGFRCAIRIRNLHHITVRIIHIRRHIAFRVRFRRHIPRFRVIHIRRFLPIRRLLRQLLPQRIVRIPNHGTIRGRRFHNPIQRIIRKFFLVSKRVRLTNFIPVPVIRVFRHATHRIRLLRQATQTIIHIRRLVPIRVRLANLVPIRVITVNRHVPARIRLPRQFPTRIPRIALLPAIRIRHRTEHRQLIIRIHRHIPTAIRLPHRISSRIIRRFRRRTIPVRLRNQLSIRIIRVLLHSPIRQNRPHHVARRIIIIRRHPAKTIRFPHQLIFPIKSRRLRRPIWIHRPRHIPVRIVHKRRLISQLIRRRNQLIFPIIHVLRHRSIRVFNLRRLQASIKINHLLIPIKIRRRGFPVRISKRRDISLAIRLLRHTTIRIKHVLNQQFPVMILIRRHVMCVIILIRHHFPRLIHELRQIPVRIIRIRQFATVWQHNLLQMPLRIPRIAEHFPRPRHHLRQLTIRIIRIYRHMPRAIRHFQKQPIRRKKRHVTRLRVHNLKLPRTILAHFFRQSKRLILRNHKCPVRLLIKKHTPAVRARQHHRAILQEPKLIRQIKRPVPPHRTILALPHRIIGPRYRLLLIKIKPLRVLHIIKQIPTIKINRLISERTMLATSNRQRIQSHLIRRRILRRLIRLPRILLRIPNKHHVPLNEQLILHIIIQHKLRPLIRNSVKLQQTRQRVHPRHPINLKRIVFLARRLVPVLNLRLDLIQMILLQRTLQKQRIRLPITHQLAILLRQIIQLRIIREQIIPPNRRIRPAKRHLIFIRRIDNFIINLCIWTTNTIHAKRRKIKHPIIIRTHKRTQIQRRILQRHIRINRRTLAMLKNHIRRLIRHTRFRRSKHIGLRIWQFKPIHLRRFDQNPIILSTIHPILRSSRNIKRNPTIRIINPANKRLVAI